MRVSDSNNHIEARADAAATTIVGRPRRALGNLSDSSRSACTAGTRTGRGGPFPVYQISTVLIGIGCWNGQGTVAPAFLAVNLSTDDKTCQRSIDLPSRKRGASKFPGSRMRVGGDFCPAFPFLKQSLPRERFRQQLVIGGGEIVTEPCGGLRLDGSCFRSSLSFGKLSTT
jgi:hypothetical protein